jgi:hypothetical protein
MKCYIEICYQLVWLCNIDIMHTWICACKRCRCIELLLASFCKHLFPTDSFVFVYDTIGSQDAKHIINCGSTLNTFVEQTVKVWAENEYLCFSHRSFEPASVGNFVVHVICTVSAGADTIYSTNLYSYYLFRFYM